MVGGAEPPVQGDINGKPRQREHVVEQRRVAKLSARRDAADRHVKGRSGGIVAKRRGLAEGGHHNAKTKTIGTSVDPSTVKTLMCRTTGQVAPRISN